MTSTLYNDRFEADDVSYRLFIFVQMLPIVGLAIAVPDGLETQSTVFALSYIAARAILLVMWVRAGWHNPIARPLVTHLVTGFSIALLLWVISVFVPTPTRFVLWSIGLLIDVLTPLTTVGIQARMPRLSASHLPERYALFTIIVLGETVISVVRSAAESYPPQLATGIACAFGLALAFSLGWVYFDNVRSQPVKPGLLWPTLRGYLHLPLFMALAAIGAGVANIIGHEEEALSEPTRWLICGALAISLFAIGIIEFTVDQNHPTSTVSGWNITICFSFAAIALLLGLMGSSFDLFVLLSFLVLLVVSQLILSLYLRFPASPDSPISAAAGGKRHGNEGRSER
jgi:low temperature requirement protein LtrA